MSVKVIDLNNLDTFKLLDVVRRRSGLFNGYNTPTHLHSFLSGYDLGVGHQNKVGTTPDFREFHDWTAKRLGFYESTSGWAYMIEDQMEDKEEAFYLFFELLDEFRQIQHKILERIPFLENDVKDKSYFGFSAEKKIHGGLIAVEKPLPAELLIREINLSEKWYQLVALKKDGNISKIWTSEDLSELYERTEKIFGVSFKNRS